MVNQINNNNLIEIYYKLPKLNIGNRQGWTDYIDFIKWDEVKYPAMAGIDVFYRKFIVVKFLIDNTKVMQTFFQRYTHGSMIMGCGHATVNLIDTSGGMNDEQQKFILDIIKNKSAIMKREYYPENDWAGKEVILFNEKEWNAAKLIQSKWRLCRYNPKYKMCEKVLMNNINLIDNPINYY